ncbi:unannotated protein [freshwater metagenome]|uniref:Unannotated protein n=1 Tax=freshwater metagenome TaxID=449393 RepID=A0A6J7PSP5_9ZZZZ
MSVDSVVSSGDTHRISIGLTGLGVLGVLEVPRVLRASGVSRAEGNEIPISDAPSRGATVSYLIRSAPSNVDPAKSAFKPSSSSASER